PPYRLRFVSGTATSREQLRSLAVCKTKDSADDCLNDVVSFTDPFDCEQVALKAFLDDRARNERVVLLHEGDTSYGGGAAARAKEDRLFTDLPYPLHVSQLWSAYLREGRLRNDPSSQLDNDAKRSLSLFPEGPESPIDVPEALYPATSANSSDRMLATLLL